MGQMSTYMQIYVQARSEDFKRGGRDFKCYSVQENVEKSTLSGALADHFLRKGGGEGPQPPPLSAYVCVSFFKLSSRQIYIVLSTLLFLSPSFALQPLHSYLTSFQIYSFYANSSFLEKFSIFFRVMTQNYICT